MSTLGKVIAIVVLIFGAWFTVVGIIMPEERSVDIDTKVDWILAEYYQNINNENS